MRSSVRYWPWLMLLLVLGCSAPTSPAPADRELDELIQVAVRYWWSQYPENASSLGIHEFDDRLARRGEGAIAAQIEQLESFLEEADQLPDYRLSLDQQVDRRLLLADLKVKLFELRDLPLFRRDPTIYIPFQAINSLLIDESRPAGVRATLLLSRLGEIPRTLSEARTHLERPPRLFTETALAQAERLLPYYRETLSGFAATVPELEADLNAAAGAAARSLEEFAGFLREELLPRSDGNLAVGRQAYDFYLKELHLLDEDADSLLAKGERWFAQTRSMLESVAREIDPDRDWHRITEDLRNDHPSRQGLLQAYCEEIQAARRHVLDRNLVSIPGPEEVRCVETPPSQRAFSPFGTFSSPPPFAESKIGYLILHPIPDGLPAAAEEARLRAHDYSWISVIAPHESYPGHHLQALQAQQNPRLLRKISHSPLFSEGWGLYCEELMYESGYFRKPLETRLTQLRLRLWRAARVILDIKLHTGQMTHQQAQQFLIDQVRFDPASAPGEVNIYAYQPAYAISYIVGFNEIVKLREEVRSRSGSDFDLRTFHDDLLTRGSLPFALMRRLVLAPAS